MSTKKRYYWNVAFIMGLIVIAAVSLSRLLQYNPAFFVDFKLRWQECAYVFRRVDPFAVMSGTARIDNVVGQIPAGAGTVPWAFILGNVFNPGFLPYAIAQKWGGYYIFYFQLGVGCSLDAFCIKINT